MPPCPWAKSALDLAYHDAEWGVPSHDDRVLFEFLILEGAQAGLSWATILRKRGAYREAFLGFDAARVARMGAADVARLLAAPGGKEHAKRPLTLPSPPRGEGGKRVLAARGGGGGVETIVRNRLKVEGAIASARAFLVVQEEFGSFEAFVWGFVDGAPRRNAWRAMSEVPAQTPESAAMSKELKRRGFKFVGPTICYAYMQAVGMVNDHLVTCPRHAACAAMR